MPAVSVLLPVRDAAPFLPACLRSLGRQTLRDIEIVAVDDGSRDGSRRILERVAAGDRRFRVLDARGRGLVAALETARAAARSPVLARCDADDIAHPDRLLSQCDALEGGPTGLVIGCRVRFFPRPAVGPGLELYECWLNEACSPREIERELFVENPIAHPTLVAPASLIDRAGGWQEGRWAEDYDLVLRLRQSGGTLAKLPAVRMAIRQHPGRLTWTDPRYGREAFLECKAHYLARGPLRGADSFSIWGAGRTGKRLARALAASHRKPAFFIDIDPAKIGGLCRGQPVVAPEVLCQGRPSLILGAVSSRGARALIRARLAGRFRLEEGRDFIMCA